MPSVAAQVRCRVVVPAIVTVSGVSGLRPAETSSPAAAATESSVVDTTTVPSEAPTSVQQRADAVRASTNRTSAPSASRNGTPAYAGTPTAFAMPGTTSKGTPAAAQASISSAAYVSSPGSPVTARTTRLPPRAASMTRCAASRTAGTPTVFDAPSTTVSWGAPVPGSEASASVCTSDTPWRACVRTTSSTSCSATRTSACASASTARRVSSPGSPGPAPRKVTCPCSGPAGKVVGLNVLAPPSDRPRPGRASRWRVRDREPVPPRACRARDRWWTAAPASSRRSCRRRRAGAFP